MVPDLPSLSRRQLLGGCAGGAALAGGSTVAVGMTAPTALPDTVTDWATQYAPKPPAASALWQPTVTEEHARAIVEFLAETEKQSNRLWEQIDPEEYQFHDSGGWLENAREELRSGNYNTAVSHAEYGMQFAADGLGRARAKLGEADRQRLAERGTDLLDRTERVVEEIGSYPVAAPSRDLAWYTRIEGALQRGRALADWHDRETFLDSETGGKDTEDPSSRPQEIGEITAKVRRAGIAIRNAEQYHDRLSAQIDTAGRQYADSLRSSADKLQGELESMPTAEAVESRYIDEEQSSYGPYEFAHARLARWCFPHAGPNPFQTTVDDEFLTLQVLGLSKALTKWRAHELVVDELVVEPDDEGFDSGHVLAEQRRAMDVFESTVGTNPPPLLAVLANRAIEDVRVSEVSRDWGKDDHWQPWHERVQAYLYALLGRAKLTHYPEQHGLLVEGA